MSLSSEPTPYLFACVDPRAGTCVFGPIAHGTRALEFARATDTVCVRWKVEQATDVRGPGWKTVEWLNVG